MEAEQIEQKDYYLLRTAYILGRKVNVTDIDKAILELEADLLIEADIIHVEWLNIIKNDLLNIKERSQNGI
jgi:hypothetical protein